MTWTQLRPAFCVNCLMSMSTCPGTMSNGDDAMDDASDIYDHDEEEGPETKSLDKKLRSHLSELHSWRHIRRGRGGS